MNYLLFAGNLCYAQGGFLDYKGSYGSEEEARNEYLDKFDDCSYGWEWAHVVNLETKQIVWKTKEKY